ncbi:MAG: nucleotidyl transferase AbiEii/AbiGii toxin family protein [Planctomycetes bacterium]|nr:nucleotidyl transferase AbiEii/AbiGii toxin family protein [Planctomycetota bacterium]
MFGDGALTFREFLMREPLPLATIHDAVLEFLRGRKDAVLFGAQAVNAYVDESRLTQDVDILSPRAEALAEEVRDYLGTKFQIAVRVREVKEGLGYRVYQMRKPKNRHLVDVRSVEHVPPSQPIEEVQVLVPVELVCWKLASMVSRLRTPKGASDLADIRRLLLAFPNLKEVGGEVSKRLLEVDAPATTLEAWRDLALQEIEPEDADQGF